VSRPGSGSTRSPARTSQRSRSTLLRKRRRPDKLPTDERVAEWELKEYQRMRPGRLQIRPLGGWPECLLMILFSVVASVVLTVLLNLLVR
jgi:hypothetical protein